MAYGHCWNLFSTWRFHDEMQNIIVSNFKFSKLCKFVFYFVSKFQICFGANYTKTRVYVIYWCLFKIYIYCTLDLNKIAGKCTSVFVCRSNFCNKWGDAFASISTRWYFLGFSHFSSFILSLLCCQLCWAFFFSSFQIMYFASHSLLYWILDMLQLLLGDRIFLYLMLKWVAP